MNTPTAATLLNPTWTAGKTKEQLMQEWIDSEAALKTAKETEMNLRLLVVERFPELVAKKEGTVYAPLANGWQLKAVKKQNYNLKAADVDDALEKYEKAAGTPEEFGRRKLITERLVSWKPTLSVKEYRELDADALKFITPILTITDGSPSLELVPPKTK